ncbi:MAG: transcription activator effector-binding protein [Flavobacteriaceae bacterium]|nr:SRPBCC family protein [Bacteroidia bacterium]MBT8286437.1 SRPBCC family protein [Bacteroidia bacterium]NNF75713.1 transcription activator effector-binding protein [Flavobacteriaceae bacterium]NNK74260.1 transcription activator effector-binding protein [Flavobacteriaceae bacterium]
MKTIKYLIFIILILVIGMAIYIGVQPNTFEVTRSRTIEAPAAVIYNNVIDYKNWAAWSSWVEKDPDLKITYPEQTKGVGGSYSWEDKDGVGTMKTLAVESNKSIEQEMQFADFAPSKVTWSFEPTEDGKTDVSWKMGSDKVPFMLKAFSVMSGGFDDMIGPDFERGLEKLDSIVVSSMKKYTITIEGIKEYGGGFYLYKTTNADNSNIAKKMGENLGSISSFMGAGNIQMTGMPLTVYHDMNNEEGTVIMSNGIPVIEKIDVPKGSDILCGYIPKTKVLKVVLLGNYTNLEEAWNKAMTYVADNNLVPSEIKPFEIYTNDPGLFPNPRDWRTEIYIPIQEITQ